MGYSTFHMLQTLWLGVIDLPTNSSEKDWDLQARRMQLLMCARVESGRCTAVDHVKVKWNGKLQQLYTAVLVQARFERSRSDLSTGFCE